MLRDRTRGFDGELAAYAAVHGLTANYEHLDTPSTAPAARIARANCSRVMRRRQDSRRVLQRERRVRDRLELDARELAIDVRAFTRREYPGKRRDVSEFTRPR